MKKAPLQQQKQEQFSSQRRLHMGEVCLIVLNVFLGLSFLLMVVENKMVGWQLLSFGVPGSLIICAALGIALKRRQLALITQALLTVLAFLALICYIVLTTTGFPIGDPYIRVVMDFFVLGSLLILSVYFAWSTWLLKRNDN